MGKLEETGHPGILRYVGTKKEYYRLDFYSDGKRHREKVEGGLTKARKELEKRREAGRNGTYVPQTTKRKYFIEDLGKRYREDKKGNSYFEKTETHYLDVIEDYFKGRKLISLSPSDILGFKKSREAVLKEDGIPRTAASSNRELALLRHILNYAVFPYEWIELNPFDKFKREWRKMNPKSKLFRKEPERKRVLKPEEIPNIFEHCHPYLQNIIKGLLLTGLRVRDLLNLKWSDIDYQEQSFRFWEQKKEDWGTKPLTEDFVSLINSIPKTDKGEGYIFVGHKGKPIKNPPKGFERMRNAAGIKDLKMRDLRRSSATALLKSGASLPAVQKHLGHTELAMTTVYLHLDDKDMKQEVSKLDGYFPQFQKNYRHKLGTNDQKESLPISEEAYNA